MGWAVSHMVKLVADEIFGQQHLVNQIVWEASDCAQRYGAGCRSSWTIAVILFYSKGDNFKLNMQYAPYDESYLKSHYKNVEEKTGRRYELDNLIGPGGAGKGNPQYSFLGVTRYWRYKEARMKELYAQGRIVQPSPGAVPRYKRYLDEMPGVPFKIFGQTLTQLIRRRLKHPDMQRKSQSDC